MEKVEGLWKILPDWLKFQSINILNRSCILRAKINKGKNKMKARRTTKRRKRTKNPRTIKMGTIKVRKAVLRKVRRKKRKTTIKKIS